MSRQATLIYNPHAGAGSWNEAIQRVADFWQQRGYQMTLKPTQRAKQATQLAKAAADAGHRLVIAAGGDGTLNEVANGLVCTETIMAPLPVGTTNSFSKELGIPQPNLLVPDSLLETTKALADGKVQRMDVGRCDNGRHWLLWAGTGIDGYLVDKIEPRSKLFKRMGTIGYTIKTFMLLPWFPTMQGTVTIDDEVIEGEFVLINISNCGLYAGGRLHLNRQAVLDDGLFEIWLFRGRGGFAVLRHLQAIQKEEHIHHPDVIKRQGRRVLVETEPTMPSHLDGEPIGNTPFTCKIQAGALRLLAPQNTSTQLFRQSGETL